MRPAGQNSFALCLARFVSFAYFFSSFSFFAVLELGPAHNGRPLKRTLLHSAPMCAFLLSPSSNTETNSPGHLIVRRANGEDTRKREREREREEATSRGQAQCVHFRRVCLIWLPAVLTLSRRAKQAHEARLRVATGTRSTCLLLCFFALWPAHEMPAGRGHTRASPDSKVSPFFSRARARAQFNSIFIASVCVCVCVCVCVRVSLPAR